jgi:hypothetical protein
MTQVFYWLCPLFWAGANKVITMEMLGGWLKADPSDSLTNDRVQCNAAGQVVLKRKTAWRDGTMPQ